MEERVSRSAVACNACRMRKQKCGGEKPTCIRCRQIDLECVWPQQQKRGPAKGYIDALEARLFETEEILFRALSCISTDDLSRVLLDNPLGSGGSSCRSGPPDRKLVVGSWTKTPLKSLADIRTWYDERRRDAISAAKSARNSSDIRGLAEHATLQPTANSNEENPSPHSTRRSPDEQQGVEMRSTLHTDVGRDHMLALESMRYSEHHIAADVIDDMTTGTQSRPSRPPDQRAQQVKQYHLQHMTNYDNASTQPSPSNSTNDSIRREIGASVPPIEIGSLTAVSPNESKFIGSSSGIFFVNTVRRAFAVSKVRSPEGVPYAETYIGGVDNQQDDEDHAQSHAAGPDAYGIDIQLLGQPPSREHASKLIHVYFQVWHPLFPFLHEPTLLEEVEKCYAEGNVDKGAQDITARRRAHCRAIIFQCIFNIAALDRPDLSLSPKCSIRSTIALTTQLCSLATGRDIQVLQALLAGQIYLIATMSLHAASTVGGVLMRLILHGGLHRCPCRYSQISSHDAEIRKRIFWSAYVADRHLSQSLGLPLGIQDSDIDVCIPGAPELHRPVQIQAVAESPKLQVSHHLPSGHPALTQAQSDPSVLFAESSLRPRSASSRSQPADGGVFREKHPGEDALAHHIAYGRLTGRALEILHKSINVRTTQYSNVLELKSDVHSFWNSLPQQLQDLPKSNKSSNNGTSPNILGLFFTIIYQQLILWVNRPFLSLEPSSLEFRLSLQTCIGSSRSIISTLSGQASGNPCVSWPGTLSVTWMSGLILAFACALDLYPVEKGFPEIKSCLQLLEGMGASSATAKHCYSALRVLLDDLSSSYYSERLENFATRRSSSNKRPYTFDSTQESHNDENGSTSENGKSKRRRSHDSNPKVQGEVPDGNGDATVSSPEQNESVSTSSVSNPIVVAFQPDVYPIDNDPSDNTAQIWFQQSGSDFGLSDHPTAFDQDMFASLSFENLLQYDEGFESGFWNSNNFLGL